MNFGDVIEIDNFNELIDYDDSYRIDKIEG